MRTTRLFLWVLLPAVCATIAWAHLDGPPPGHTGAPGEGTCADAGCHDQFTLNGGPGLLNIEAIPPFWFVDESICPPEPVHIAIGLEQPGASRWGFQLAALDDSGRTMGTLLLVDADRTQASVDSAGRLYVSHTAVGSDGEHANAAPGWSVSWIPEPLPPPQSRVTLFASALAADDDGTAAGDYVYTGTVQLRFVFVDCFGLSVPGDVNESGSVTSADIIYLINFIFRGGPMPSYHPMFGEINCDGTVNSADVIALVRYIFQGGWGPSCEPCIHCCATDETNWYCEFP